MEILLARITPRRAAKSSATDTLAAEYMKRSTRYALTVERAFTDERSLLLFVEKAKPRPQLILLDSIGRLQTSEEFAADLGRARDASVPGIVFAVGPADGWSGEARARANGILSLGRITLPHELARVVLAEQVYRALTILARHPYHSGH